MSSYINKQQLWQEFVKITTAKKEEYEKIKAEAGPTGLPEGAKTYYDTIIGTLEWVCQSINDQNGIDIDALKESVDQANQFKRAFSEFFKN